MRVEQDSVSICLLGPPVEHRDGLSAALHTFTNRVGWIPDFGTFRRIRQHLRPRGRLLRGMESTFGIRDPDYLELLHRTYEERRPDVIVAYWGTLPLGEIMTCRRLFPRVRIILVMLCHPLGLHSIAIARQNFGLRMAARYFDAVVCPTEDMAVYLRRYVLAPGGPSAAVIPPCWPRAFLAKDRPQSAEDAPSIVYAGRMDFSSPTIQATDDVRLQMDQLLRAGIHLFHGETTSPYSKHPLRHVFPRRSVQDLIHTMATYDASLIMYNLETCSRDDRFNLTVPDRLISSVAAGVPIAVPRAGYKAAKSYLARYGAMIEFDDWFDLREKLQDRANVQALKDRAWAGRLEYCAEETGQDFRVLVEDIIWGRT